jgi:hypothetical protein
MNKFIGYIKNDQYAIGCSGQTVYIFNSSGHELAKFKDLKYAYLPMFIPCQSKLVVKSVDAHLAVYSLDSLKLITKFRFSKIGYAQDDGLCFSKDGRYLYNIERHIQDIHSSLSIYETTDYKRISQLFLDDPLLELRFIEYDEIRDGIYVLGFMRGHEGVMDYGFVALLQDNHLIQKTQLPTLTYEYLEVYKGIEKFGFTSKKIRLSLLDENRIDLADIMTKKIKLSDYIRI